MAKLVLEQKGKPIQNLFHVLLKNGLRENHDFLLCVYCAEHNKLLNDYQTTLVDRVAEHTVNV